MSNICKENWLDNLLPSSILLVYVSWGKGGEVVQFGVCDLVYSIVLVYQANGECSAPHWLTGDSMYTGKVGMELVRLCEASQQ